MRVADANTVKLYLRLPVKIIDDQQIKDLHPGIVKVTLPRQKSRRWCFVEFDSTNVKAAIKELIKLEVNGKKVYVNAHKIKSENKKEKKED